MRDILLYLVAVLIWGTTWFAITFQLGVVAIEWSLVYRFALATVVLFAICLGTGRELKFPRRAHLVFLGLGAFLFSSNYYFSYLGVAYITSGLVAVVFSTLPLMNIFNGRVFLKRRLEPAIVVASLVGIGGIALMFWPELGAGASNDKALLGMVIVLIATYLASLGNTIAGGRSASKLPVLSMSAWGMLYGTGFLTAASLLNGNPVLFETTKPYIFSLVYLSLFGTVIAFTSYLELIKRIGAERAGYISVAFPVVALAISTFFEGYQWSIPAALGMVLVLGGNVYILRTRQKKVEPRPA
ncbi:MAG: DMT family transporter [Proteobacteria bacterium]|nr:DMT family transporter [Pseudomonadota bacterium]